MIFLVDAFFFTGCGSNSAVGCSTDFIIAYIGSFGDPYEE